MLQEKKLSFSSLLVAVPSPGNYTTRVSIPSPFLEGRGRERRKKKLLRQFLLCKTALIGSGVCGGTRLHVRCQRYWNQLLASSSQVPVFLFLPSFLFNVIALT